MYDGVKYRVTELTVHFAEDFESEDFAFAFGSLASKARKPDSSKRS